MIYLDNNATTKPLPEVISGVVRCLEQDWGNPSSSHEMGSNSAEVIEISRDHVAELLNVEATQIYFTSGATEANESTLRHFVNLGYEIILSETEHPSLLRYYESFLPSKINYLSVDNEGKLALEDMVNLLQVGGGEIT